MSLSTIMQQAQTDLFEKYGVFFAFSNEQVAAQKVEGVEYCSMGGGMICPKEHADIVYKSLGEIYRNGIATDVAQNGIDKVILRELYNHESFYIGSTSNCADALADYPCTREDISRVYKEHYAKACEDF